GQVAARYTPRAPPRRPPPGDGGRQGRGRRAPAGLRRDRVDVHPDRPGHRPRGGGLRAGDRLHQLAPGPAARPAAGPRDLPAGLPAPGPVEGRVAEAPAARGELPVRPGAGPDGLQDTRHPDQAAQRGGEERGEAHGQRQERGQEGRRGGVSGTGYASFAHPGADRPARQRHRPVGPADGVQEALRPPPESPLRVPGRRGGGGQEGAIRRRRRSAAGGADRASSPSSRPSSPSPSPRPARPATRRTTSRAAVDVRERREGPGGGPAAPRAAHPAGGGDGPGGPGLRGPGGGEEGEQRVQPPHPRDTEQSAPRAGNFIRGGDFAHRSVPRFLFSNLLRQDPTDVARSATVQSEPVLSRPVELVPKRDGRKSAGAAPSKTRVVRTATTTRASAPAGGSSLRAHLASERRRIERSASSRHSHFGGTVMVEDGLGKRAYVSANDYLSRRLQSAGSGGGRHAASSLGRPARRRNRKAEVFVGSGKSSSLHSRPGASAASSREVAGPASRRAKAALHGFCTRFLEQCYGPVMKSLKNEFRRDSTRLEEGDRAIFFRIVWFFHQWWRAARGGDDKEKGDDGAKPDGKTVAGNLVFTMDVFMFNLVLNSTDEFHERRRPAPLAQTVALYAEMVQTLAAMYDSPDGTERMMALGLMDRLFYASEPLDRLPRLFSRWTPGLHSREYLCDLVECSHATWRLLDTNDERCRPPSDGEGGTKRRPKDTVERFNMAASEFDRNGYFLRKFVSNQIVFMYTQLLSRYDVNSAEVNRHAVAYLVRLCKHEVRTGDVDDDEYDDGPGGNELATRRSTLEPMLYNIGMLSTLDRILNDTSIRDREEFASLLMFAASFMKRFARAAEANPMLYVEAMFKHPNPHRFCAVTSNMYVNEELRMMTVRDMLVEDQRKYEQNGEEDDFEEAAAGGEEEKEEDVRPKYDSDDEEEVEFDGDDLDEGVVGRNKKKRRKPSRRKRKWKSSALSPVEDNNDNSGDEDDPVSGTDRGNPGSTDADGDATEEDKERDVAAPRMPPDGPPEDEPSPRLSGRKRIRKTLALEDSDDDDDDAFFNNAPSQPKAKRAILDDSDDED
ncbi:hypothetical protein THAOC_15394, partial [Thalassiosira oceanica]